jgi:hypothetical protein
MSTISVTGDVKEKLFKIATELQAKLGRRVDLNETMDYLIFHAEKRPDLLEKATRPLPSSLHATAKSAYSELISERRKDERRSARRYGS